MTTRTEIERMVDRAIARTAWRRRTPKAAAKANGKMALDASVANRLFQLSPGDPDYREPPARRAFTYALDAVSEHEDDVAEHIQHALTHVTLADNGNADLDLPRLRGYLERALESLRGAADALEDVTRADEHGGPIRVQETGEDDDPDSEPDAEAALSAGGLWETERDQPNEELSGGRDRKRARDGQLGETAARSAVTRNSASVSNGRRTDHRKDFNSYFEGGADSAHGFDGDALFQRKR